MICCNPSFVLFQVMVKGGQSDAPGDDAPRDDHLLHLEMMFVT